MKRIAFFVYGVVAYTISFSTILYLIGFVGNILVPKTVDGPQQVSTMLAIGINLSLLGVFAIQHSIMARGWFKRWWTKYIPEPIERSTYTLFTVAVLVMLFYFWQPIEGVVWSIDNGLITGMLWALFALGWVILVVSTFLLNHFDLFGLRQVWLNLLNKPYTHLKFSTPLFYKWVRHPLYFGFILAFWSAPVMSYTRLFLAVVFTLYILKAIRWEENDLVIHFGEKYRSYSRKVPMLLPSFVRSKEETPSFETIIKGNG